jgi:hypothetical protein
MKTFRQKGGPFKERPYFELDDIERICSDELRSLGLLPAEPAPVRIERFIERRFAVTPVYEDLPDEVLGFSEFGPKGVQAIVLSRALAEDESTAAARRVSTTLAHEAGHGLLHAHLFVLGAPQSGIFGTEVTGPKILCRTASLPTVATGRNKYDGQWWEFQANQAIGALLLPRHLVAKAVKPILVSVGTLGVAYRIKPEDREKAAALVAEIFDVNPAVARIRLHELYPVDGGQLTL